MTDIQTTIGTRTSGILSIQNELEKNRLSAFEARKVEHDFLKEQEALIPLEQAARELKMGKQREEGLEVGGEANKSELEGAIESGDDDDKLLGYEDSENNADGVKEAHAVYTLTPGKPTIPDDDDKSKHPPRPKAIAHKADSDSGEEEEEDSENADEDTDDEMHDDHHDNVDDEYGYWFMSQIQKRPERPSSFAYPASLLSYVQETHCHDRPPSTDTVLVYILEDEKGLARDNRYPVWEMERQKRKMKVERVSVSYSNLMKAECCLAILNRMERKSRGN